MSDKLNRETEIKLESRDPIDVIAQVKNVERGDEQPKGSFEIAWDLAHSA